MNNRCGWMNEGPLAVATESCQRIMYVVVVVVVLFLVTAVLACVNG